nr:MAG TPA: Protein of unknown function (DUF1043) [Caudoviricetes sp.]
MYMEIIFIIMFTIAGFIAGYLYGKGSVKNHTENPRNKNTNT